MFSTSQHSNYPNYTVPISSAVAPAHHRQHGGQSRSSVSCSYDAADWCMQYTTHQVSAMWSNSFFVNFSIKLTGCKGHAMRQELRPIPRQDTQALRATRSTNTSDVRGRDGLLARYWALLPVSTIPFPSRRLRSYPHGRRHTYTGTFRGQRDHPDCKSIEACTCG